MSSSVVHVGAPFTPFHCFYKRVGMQMAKVAHTHDTHELLVCTNASGSHFVEGREIAQHRGDFFCFPAGLAHWACGRPRAPLGVYVIMVPDSMFAPDGFGDRETFVTLQRIVHLACGGRHPIPLHRRTGERLLSLARDLVEEFRGGRPGFQAASRMLLQNILLHVMRDPLVGAGPAPVSRAVRHDGAVAHVLRHVDDHFMNEITVSAMAEAAGMSRSHFHAVFRGLTGCTLVDYLTRVRVRAAQRLLRESDAPVVEVALDCGFATLSRFYEAFKVLTGKTPGQVRRGE